MRKLLAVAAVLIVIAAGGYYGFTKYQSNALIESTTPHIKEATLRTKVVIELLTAPGNATFAEMFEKSSETVKKIADTLITVESQNSSANPEAMQSATGYLKAVQEISRTIHSTSRARFESSSATDDMQEAIANLRGLTGYAFKYGEERATRAIKRAEKALEKSQNEVAAAQPALRSLRTAHANATNFFPPEALLSSDLLTALESFYSVSDEPSK